jgi:hypothetical protein
MADLGAGDERFRNDHGEADPAVSAALAAYASRTGDEHAVLTALAGSRLLVPVVAVLAEEMAADEVSGDASGGAGGQQAGRDGHVPGPGVFPGGEKASEMAMPVIVARDGRRALPAFTCAAALRRWKPEGRPVPVPAAGVWQSAVQESCAVIIDIAGPVPLAVEGSRLAALAAGGRVLALHEDPDAWQLVAAAAAEFAPGVRVRLSPPNGGLDFTLELAPPDGATRPVPEEAASQIGDAVTARLGERIRTGIAVLVRPPA